MYDSREKAILDYESGLIDARQEGRKEGRKEGRQEGETIGIEKGQAIGKIQMLQELLGVSISDEKSLRLESLERLSSTLQELQAKLRDRNAG